MIPEQTPKCLKCPQKEKWRFTLICLPTMWWERFSAILKNVEIKYTTDSQEGWIKDTLKKIDIELKKDEHTRSKTERTVQNPGSQE